MNRFGMLGLRSALAVLAVASFAGVARAQVADITVPTDEVLIVNGQNDGDGNGGNPPPTEGVANAIDNTTNKYLNFLDLGSGLIINPALNKAGGGTIVTGLRLYTANDSESRDPASYLLEGSHFQSGPFETISSGSLALPSGRNATATPAIAINAATQVNQLINFNNTTGYVSYRLTFPTLKGAGPGIDPNAANSMQIAEIELLGVAVPEPTSLGLLAVAGVGMLARRRNRA